MRSKKKIGLSALGGVLLAVTVFSAYRTYDAYATLKQESNLLLENLVALAEGDEAGGHNTGEFPRYINKTKFTSNTEFRTEIGENGITVEWERKCTYAITYCDDTGNDNDTCYKELNGVINTCDSWTEKD